MTRELTRQPHPARLLFSALRPAASRRPAWSGAPVGDVRIRKVVQDRDRLYSYQDLCGFTRSERVPATWLHVLTFPLQTAVMSGHDWPFPSLGMVHVTNSLRMYRSVTVDEVLDIHVCVSHVNPHRKGTTVDLVAIIRVGKEMVCSGRFTYLVPGYEVPGKAVDVPREKLPETDPVDSWDLPADLGRRYAKVSQDYNPIHLWSLTARMFGFPRTIIHGMWTHARALAAYEAELPDAYEVRVQFTKPITLPSTIHFLKDGGSFGVVGKDKKPRLTGWVREIHTDLTGQPL